EGVCLDNIIVEKKWKKNIKKAPNFLPLEYQVLINRGLESEEVEEFILSDKFNFHDPFLFKDMEKAVEIIIEAIRSNKKILVYGDYDVDGVTSTAILYHFFEMVSYQINYFIPDRVEDGYGLNINVLEELSKSYDVFITVDCGITANEEIDYLKSIGKEVIITDHHQQGERLPSADAIINPHLEHDYPTKFLSGAGVALKLAQGLAKRLKGNKFDWDLLFALSAIGTVADIVPLQRENRLITKVGLEAINTKDLNFGINALIKVSGLKKGSISTGNIAFGIAPRINASGRLGSALDALNLLITKNEEEAYSLAENLDLQNEKRKAIEQKILSQALKMIDVEDNIHILYNKEWQHGVLGIVASKIVEHTYKPTILLGEGKDCIKGSGRSIKGIHLQQLLLDHDEFLVSHGGHELAAGLSLKEEDFEEFKSSMKRKVDSIFNDKEFYPVIRIDLTESIPTLNYTTACDLEALGPFGFGNPQPNILLESVEIADIQNISKGKHTKIVVKDFFDGLECLLWNTENISFSVGDKIDVLGTLTKNEWMNIKSASLVVKDIKGVGKFNIIDKRNEDFESLSILEEDGVVIASFYNYFDFEKESNYEDIFQPKFYNYKNGNFNCINDLSSKIFKNLVLYDIPFFANQLNKLPLNKNSKLILNYGKDDYHSLKKLLSSLAIDRDYLYAVYKRIKKDVIINISELSEKSIKEKAKNQKFFEAVKIFDEMNLIEFSLVRKDGVKIKLKHGQKVNIGDSLKLRNFNELVQRAEKESKFLLKADVNQLNKYVRRV
ncbi:MAG: single-stranded-DNA-specific exonuclease RecJ, partial [Clostridia bacterium]